MENMMDKNLSRREAAEIAKTLCDRLHKFAQACKVQPASQRGANA